MIFLVTNDDGVDSPMLPLLVEKLKSFGRVRVVVPLREQSWTGKSMTRLRPVSVKPCDQFDVEAFTVEGTPSDCVNLGVHNLFPEPPDWVISGINIGSNAGLAFMINSGTVGAAIEGAIQGIPSVAFSQQLPPKTFAEWNRTGRITDKEAVQGMQEAADGAGRIMQTVLEKGLPGDSALLNVNLPPRLTSKTPVRWTRMMNTRYGSVFKAHDGGFLHGVRSELLREQGEGMYWDTVRAGEISVTPMTLPGLTYTGKTTYEFR